MEDDDALKDPTLDRPHSDALQIQAGLIHSKAAAIERLAAARALNAAAMRAEAAALRELQTAEACYESERPKKIPPQTAEAHHHHEKIQRAAARPGKL